MATRYHQAASDSYLELLKEATKRDLNLSDDDGMTPTLLAAYHGNLEALEIICSRGGDPDKCDIWGNTPLHYAASNGHTHCISFLVNFGANIFALDNDLKSPLDAAASREQKECVALLDKAATIQNTKNPKKVARLKEQALRNARRQMRECERLQEKHQSKMARTYSKEDSGTFSSSHRAFSGSSLSKASTGGFGSLSKGIKDTFKLKFKKNKDTAEQVEQEDRNGQRHVMEVFGEEEEEDSFPDDFGKKLRFSAGKANDVQHESILNRPGLGSIVLRRNRVLDLEDISDSKRELGFKMPSELFERQGAADEEEDEEGEADGTAGDLPWDEDEVEWEEDVADATPLEVFLQAQHLEDFLPVFMREQIDLEALLLCSDEDLQNIHMQLGPRKKVLNAIDKRKQALRQPGQLVDTSL
ncbi:ankyrin repeat and SAM domain-containing protein 4B [Arvicola amphibius]|uniref:ankyrin repeat and SAM domain-containing protein 4B n=1 Tax=Arvicola amphibius TaxID=1047088 RepID=UPI0018E3456C|nr:ankyrin repeat and SAM domain-containing protein 4B [Arvicola amphibius]